MAAAIPLAGALDPDCRREAARARFSQDGMVARYFDLYGALAGRRAPAVTGP